MALKMKVVSSSATKSGSFVSKLNYRQDTEIQDALLGTVIKTQSDYYYVKTKAPLELNKELDVDLNNYDIEETTFKNTDEKSAYYGDNMEAKWLTPKV